MSDVQKFRPRCLLCATDLEYEHSQQVFRYLTDPKNNRAVSFYCPTCKKRNERIVNDRYRKLANIL